MDYHIFLLALFVLMAQCAQWRGRMAHAMHDLTITYYVDEWEKVKKEQQLAKIEWTEECSVGGDQYVVEGTITAEHNGFVEFILEGAQVKEGRPIFKIVMKRPRVTRRQGS